MTEVYAFTRGSLPLLVSVPHDGRKLAPGLSQRMTATALRLPDTDWHVARLYGFARDMGASVLIANYSRYVVDLNRPANDDALYPGQLSSGLCPAKTFAGEAVYIDEEGLPAAEQTGRIQSYWQPYHEKIGQELDRLRQQYGYALLWDAHSIRGEVPLLFDGALPDLNIGTNNGISCDARLQSPVVAAARASPYTAVVNERFKGGFITRHYGQPEQGLHAIQLELAQRCYMDENSGEYNEVAALQLEQTLQPMLEEFVASANRYLR